MTKIKQINALLDAHPTNLNRCLDELDEKLCIYLGVKAFPEEGIGKAQVFFFFSKIRSKIIHQF